MGLFFEVVRQTGRLLDEPSTRDHGNTELAQYGGPERDYELNETRGWGTSTPPVRKKTTHGSGTSGRVWTSNEDTVKRVGVFYTISKTVLEVEVERVHGLRMQSETLELRWVVHCR